MKRQIIISLIAMFSLQTMAQAPTVTTDTRHARGATMAFGRALFRANGSTISKRGFCYSETNRRPTIEDSLSSGTLSNNGLIFKMTNLKPGTMYYARAYATAADGSTGYGDVIKIVTVPKGTIGWGYNNGGSAEENQRINAAVKECVEYWNNLTSIQGLYLNVNYGAQTPTADCSYGGWMRVGPNAAYQSAGTIMHEALHAIGVGTHSRWNGASTPLRAGAGTGQFLGSRTTELVHFLGNDNSAVMNGDATHLWPYGINGAHEDNGTEFLYTANSLVAQSVCEDGIPATTSAGCAAPHYAFDQEDTTVYYIKNESETYGLYSSYLVEASLGRIQWKTMTAAEAARNDAAKWNVTFTASNQFYQIKNVSTGKYMSYHGTGNNGIRMVAREMPTDAENFQFHRSRCDVTSDAGTLITPERGYWVIRHTDSETPGCLAGASGNLTRVVTFDLANSAADQRWLFLTAEQAAEIEKTAVTASRDAYTKMKLAADAILATPHVDITEGATADLTTTVDSYTAEVDTTNSSGAIQTRTAELSSAILAFLGQVKATDAAQPFDVTFLINNPSLESRADGWKYNSGYAWGSGAVEFYQKDVQAMQVLKGMPKGSYTFKVYGFQRPGTNDDQYTAYNAGTAAQTVRIYVTTPNNGHTYLKNVMAERSAKSLHGDDKKMADGTYVPNTMVSAAAHFAAGYYDNEVLSYVKTPGQIALYISGANSNSSSWTIFSDFRLYYYGDVTKDEVTGIEGITIMPAERRSGAIYDLQGRYRGFDASRLDKGLYIINGKKVVID